MRSLCVKWEPDMWGISRKSGDIVHPHHGVITSIGPQHLETFFNMDNIVHTKYELADALPADGMLFLNGDNEYVTGNSDAYANKIFYRSQTMGEGYRRRIFVVPAGN